MSLRRRIEPETLKGIGVLFVLKPWIGLDDNEVETLEEWVKAGHALQFRPHELLERLNRARQCVSHSRKPFPGVFIAEINASCYSVSPVFLNWYVAIPSVPIASNAIAASAEVSGSSSSA